MMFLYIDDIVMFLRFIDFGINLVLDIIVLFGNALGLKTNVQKVVFILFVLVMRTRIVCKICSLAPSWYFHVSILDYRYR
jgi:hypothetical protein